MTTYVAERLLFQKIVLVVREIGDLQNDSYKLSY